VPAATGSTGSTGSTGRHGSTGGIEEAPIFAWRTEDEDGNAAAHTSHTPVALSLAFD
jgi:hypothetical protein